MFTNVDLAKQLVLKKRLSKLNEHLNTMKEDELLIFFYWLLEKKENDVLFTALEERKVDLNKDGDSNSAKRITSLSRSLLMKAVMDSNLAAVEKLIAANACVDKKSYSYIKLGKVQQQYPIEIALETGNAEIFKLLAKYSALKTKSTDTLALRLMHIVRQLVLNQDCSVSFSNQDLTDNTFKILASSLKDYAGEQCQIKLENCKLTDKHALALCLAINKKQNIKSLNLSYNSLSDETILKILSVISANKSLREIDLSGMKLTIEHTRQLANIIRRSTSLREIKLDQCELNFDAMNLITDALLETRSSLNKISVRNNKVTDYGLVKLLRAIKANCNGLAKSLKEINYDGCATNRFLDFAFETFFSKESAVSIKHNNPGVVRIDSFKRIIADSINKVQRHQKPYHDKHNLHVCAKETEANVFHFSFDIADILRTESKMLNLYDSKQQQLVGKISIVDGILLFEAKDAARKFDFDIQNNKQITLQQVVFSCPNTSLVLNAQLDVAKSIAINADNVMLHQQSKIDSNLISIEARTLELNGKIHAVASELKAKSISASGELITDSKQYIKANDVYLNGQFTFNSADINADVFQNNAQVCGNINVTARKIELLPRSNYSGGDIKHVAPTITSEGSYTCETAMFYGDKIIFKSGEVKPNKFGVVCTDVKFDEVDVDTNNFAVYAQETIDVNEKAKLHANVIGQFVAPNQTHNGRVDATDKLDFKAGKIEEYDGQNHINLNGNIHFKDSANYSAHILSVQAKKYHGQGKLTAEELVHINAEHLHEESADLAGKTITLESNNEIIIDEHANATAETINVFSENINFKSKHYSPNKLNLIALLYSTALAQLSELTADKRSLENIKGGGHVSINTDSYIDVDEFLINAASVCNKGKSHANEQVVIKADELTLNAASLSSDKRIFLSGSKKVSVTNASHVKSDGICEVQARKVRIEQNSSLDSQDILLHNSTNINLVKSALKSKQTILLDAKQTLKIQGTDLLSKNNCILHAKDGSADVTSRILAPNVTVSATNDADIDCYVGDEINGAVSLRAHNYLKLSYKASIRSPAVDCYGKKILINGEVQASNQINIEFGDDFKITQRGSCQQGAALLHPEKERITGSVAIRGGRVLVRNADQITMRDFTQQEVIQNPPRAVVEGQLMANRGDLIVDMPCKSFEHYARTLCGDLSAATKSSYLTVTSTGEIKAARNLVVRGEEWWIGNTISADNIIAKLDRGFILGASDLNSFGFATIDCNTLQVNASAYYNFMSFVNARRQAAINSLFMLDLGLTSSHQTKKDSLLSICDGLSVASPEGIISAFKEFDFNKQMSNLFKLDDPLAIISQFISICQLFFKQYSSAFKMATKAVQTALRARFLLNEIHKLISRSQQGESVQFAEFIPFIVTGTCMLADFKYAYDHQDDVKKDFQLAYEKSCKAVNDIKQHSFAAWEALKTTCTSIPKTIPSEGLICEWPTETLEALQTNLCETLETLTHASKTIAKTMAPKNKMDVFRYIKTASGTLGLMPNYSQTSVGRVAPIGAVLTGNVTRSNAYNYSTHYNADIGLAVTDISNYSVNASYVRGVDVFILGGDLTLGRNGNIGGIAVSLIADTLNQEANHELHINGRLETKHKLKQNQGRIFASKDSRVKTKEGIEQHNQSQFIVGEKQNQTPVEKTETISNQTQTENDKNSQTTNQRQASETNSDQSVNVKNVQQTKQDNHVQQQADKTEKPKINLKLGEGVSSNSGSQFVVHQGRAIAKNLLATSEGHIQFNPGTSLTVDDVKASGGNILFDGLQHLAIQANALSNKGGKLGFENLAETEIKGNLTVTQDGKLETKAARIKTKNADILGEHQAQNTELHAIEHLNVAEGAKQEISNYVALTSDNTLTYNAKTNLAEKSFLNLKSQELNSTKAEVIGQGNMTTTYEKGELSSTLKPGILQVETSSIQNYHDFLSGTGQYAQIQPTQKLFFKTQQDLTINQTFSRQCDMGVTANSVDIVTGLNSDYSLSFTSTTGGIKTRQILDAANLYLYSASDIEFNGQQHRAKGIFSAYASNNLNADRGGAQAIDIHLHAGNDSFLRASNWQASNYFQSFSGNTVYLEGVEQGAAHHKSFHKTTITSGAGIGHDDIGTKIFAENKVHTGATEISALGHNVVNGKNSIELKAQIGRECSEKNPDINFWRVKTEKSDKETAYTTTILSKLGSNFFESENGGLRSEGTNLISLKGKNEAHVQGDIIQQDVVLKEKTTVKREYLGGLFSSKKPSKHEVSKENIVYDTNTILHSREGKHHSIGTQFIGSGELNINAKYGSTISARVLNHTVSENKWSIDVQAFGSESLKQLLQGNSKEAFSEFLKQDPVFNSAIELLKSNTLPEGITNTSNLLLSGYNNAFDFAKAINNDNLKETILSRYGLGGEKDGQPNFNPTVSVNVEFTHSKSKFQTLGPGSIQKDKFTVTCSDGDLRLENGVSVDVHDMIVDAQNFYQSGAKLKSSFSSKGGSITLTGTKEDGLVAVGGGYQQQKEKRTNWHNQQVNANNLTLNLSHGQWHMNAANATVDNLTIGKPIQIFDIKSRQDKSKSSGFSVKVNSNGIVSGSVNYQSDKNTSRPSGLRVNNRATGFHVDEYHNKGGYVSVSDKNDFSAQQTFSRDLTDQKNRFSFSTSVNLKAFFSNNDQEKKQQQAIPTQQVGVRVQQYEASRAAITHHGNSFPDLKPDVKTNVDTGHLQVQIPTSFENVSKANSEIAKAASTVKEKLQSFFGSNEVELSNSLSSQNTVLIPVNPEVNQADETKEEAEQGKQANSPEQPKQGEEQNNQAQDVTQKEAKPNDSEKQTTEAAHEIKFDDPVKQARFEYLLNEMQRKMSLGLDCSDISFELCDLFRIDQDPGKSTNSASNYQDNNNNSSTNKYLLAMQDGLLNESSLGAITKTASDMVTGHVPTKEELSEYNKRQQDKNFGERMMTGVTSMVGDLPVFIGVGVGAAAYAAACVSTCGVVLVASAAGAVSFGLSTLIKSARHHYEEYRADNPNSKVTFKQFVDIHGQAISQETVKSALIGAVVPPTGKLVTGVIGKTGLAPLITKPNITPALSIKAPQSTLPTTVGKAIENTVEGVALTTLPSLLHDGTLPSTQESLDSAFLLGLFHLGHAGVTKVQQSSFGYRPPVKPLNDVAKDPMDSNFTYSTHHSFGFFSTNENTAAKMKQAIIQLENSSSSAVRNLFAAAKKPTQAQTLEVFGFTEDHIFNMRRDPAAYYPPSEKVVTDCVLTGTKGDIPTDVKKIHEITHYHFQNTPPDLAKLAKAHVKDQLNLIQSGKIGNLSPEEVIAYQYIFEAPSSNHYTPSDYFTEQCSWTLETMHAFPEAAKAIAPNLTAELDIWAKQVAEKNSNYPVKSENQRRMLFFNPVPDLPPIPPQPSLSPSTPKLGSQDKDE